MDFVTEMSGKDARRKHELLVYDLLEEKIEARRIALKKENYGEV